MKKIVSVLLAVFMLCSFAALQVSAEDLTQEQAKAIVWGAKDAVESGKFTVNGEAYLFMMDGERMMSQDTHRFSGSVFRTRAQQLAEDIAVCILGEHHRLITTPEGDFLVLPKLRLYAKIDPGKGRTHSRVEDLQNLWPEEEPDSFTLETKDEKTAVAAVHWDNYKSRGKEYELQYTIKDGAISRIDPWYNKTLLFSDSYMFLQGISAGIDESYFSTKGMLKLPWRLMEWLTGWIWIDYTHDLGYIGF